jgi:hypothetical protein
MNWEIVLFILVIFGIAAFIEHRRAPQVREWALRHGFDVTTQPGPELDAALRSDAQAFGSPPAWGYGMVLTREWSRSHVRICEYRMRLQRGTAWHIMAAIRLDCPINQEAVGASLPSFPGKLDWVIYQRDFVWRRRGLLWPKRLDRVLGEAEELLQLLLRTSDESLTRS